MRRLPALLLLSIFGLLFSCDDGDREEAPPDAPWVAGDRLSVREIAFPGGEPVQVGWYDEELRTPCTFRRAADGQVRCLPQTGVFDFHAFASPDCSESSALARRSNRCGPTPTFATTPGLSNCPAEAHVFRLGERYTGDRFIRVGEDCLLDEFEDENADFYERGEEIAPDEMVAGERIPSGSSRLKRYMMTAEDGAQGPDAPFVDSDLGDDCFFFAAADGSQRCIPIGHGFSIPPDQFSDENCSQPALDAHQCPDSSLAVGIDESACELRFSVFELDPPIANATVYSKDGEECRAVDTRTDSSQFRPIGEEVPPSALIAGEPELRGEARVRSRWIRLAGMSSLFDGWWDTEFDTRCSLMSLEDGDTVCAPSDTALISDFAYFSGRSCRMAVTVVVLREACERELIARQFVDGCPQTRFFRVAGPVDGELYTRDPNTSNCRAVTDMERARLRRPGEEIPLSELERVEASAR